MSSRKNSYMPYYKCLMCETMLYTSEVIEATDEEAEQALMGVIRNQQFAGNPYLHKVPMYVCHKCISGSVALAHFAGFKRVG